MNPRQCSIISTGVATNSAKITTFGILMSIPMRSTRMCTRLMLLNYQSKVGSLGYMYTILSEHCHLAHALGSILISIQQ